MDTSQLGQILELNLFKLAVECELKQVSDVEVVSDWEKIYDDLKLQNKIENLNDQYNVNGEQFTLFQLITLITTTKEKPLKVERSQPKERKVCDAETTHPV